MSDIYIAKEKQEKKPRLHHGRKPSIFTAFAVSPAEVSFETQERDEQVVAFLRMHLITNVPWLFLTLLFILAPLVLRFFPLIDFLPFRFQLMSIIMWYLLVTAFVFEKFLAWVFNVYIITDERIVDIDFHNLLYKEVSETKIDKIQDVTFKMGGVIRTIFNYGDVLIQTAGTELKFEFHAVPKPDQVTKILQELRTQEEVEALEGRVK